MNEVINENLEFFQNLFVEAKKEHLVKKGLKECQKSYKLLSFVMVANDCDEIIAKENKELFLKFKTDPLFSNQTVLMVSKDIIKKILGLNASVFGFLKIPEDKNDKLNQIVKSCQTLLL